MSGRHDERKQLLPTTMATKVETQHHKLLGITYVAMSAICFSFMSTFIKYNTYYMTSMEAVFHRSFVALLLNYVRIIYSGQNLYVPPEQRWTLLIRCILGVSSISFAFYAISQLLLADASVIILSSPIMAFFFGACLLQESIDLPSLVCSIMSFGGLICVVRPGFIFGYGDDDSPMSAAGSWLAIGSALLGAVGQSLVYIYVSKLKGLHAMTIIHYFMLFSSLSSLVYIFLFQGVFVIPNNWKLWGSVIGSGVFTYVGQSFFTLGFQLEKAGIASVMRYLDVVFVFIWDAVLLREPINHWSVVGAVIICSCAIIIVLRRANTD